MQFIQILYAVLEVRLGMNLHRKLIIPMARRTPVLSQGAGMSNMACTFDFWLLHSFTCLVRRSFLWHQRDTCLYLVLVHSFRHSVRVSPVFHHVVDGFFPRQPSHLYKLCAATTIYHGLHCSLDWMISDADLMPNGNLRKQLHPNGVLKVVYLLLSGSSLSCQNPWEASNLLKNLAPVILLIISSCFGIW